jgi:formylmethanofuran dehydrogenase subunit E
MSEENSVIDSARFERLRDNPRADFIWALEHQDLSACLIKTAEIHGHFCPGSALGVMAAVWGLAELGQKSLLADGFEELMAIVEVNACFADGVQAVSGCTLGNNALIYRDLGKHAVTFAFRGEKTGVRVRVRPDFQEQIRRIVPEFYPLLQKVIIERTSSPEEEVTFKKTARKAAFSVIKLPFEDLLLKQTTSPQLPDYAPITQSLICSGCGEQVMASKVVTEGEKKGLCLACAGLSTRQVDGRGIEIN